jgi:endo-beta-N-acetylglucosaminidase D
LSDQECSEKKVKAKAKVVKKTNAKPAPVKKSSAKAEFTSCYFYNFGYLLFPDVIGFAGGYTGIGLIIIGSGMIYYLIKGIQPQKEL